MIWNVIIILVVTVEVYHGPLNEELVYQVDHVRDLAKKLQRWRIKQPLSCWRGECQEEESDGSNDVADPPRHVSTEADDIGIVAWHVKTIVASIVGNWCVGEKQE